MAEESQLLALQKACEIEEQKVLQRKLEIDRVRGERQAVLDVIVEKQTDLRDKIAELVGPGRRRAICRGSAGELHSISEYVERLRKELDAMEPELNEKRRELNQAAERAEIAEQEFAAARLETRRVEKLIQERNMSALVRGSAIEEAAMDELNTSRRHKT